MATSPEVLLLSAVCRTGDYKTLVKTGISPEMFHQYPEEGKWLLNYVQRYGKAPGKNTLRKQWPGVKVYAVDDVEWYCDEVKKAHAQEALLSMLDQVVDAVERDDTAKALSIIGLGVSEVEARSAGVKGSYDVFSDWGETYADVAGRVDRVSKKGYAGIPTGFTTLDYVTGGLQPGWFCVVGARLGQGKTWTGIRMAFAATATDHTVEYWSLEQNRHQVAMRVHSFASKAHSQYLFNSLDLTRGRGFDLIQYKKFLDGLKDTSKGKFLVNDSSRGAVTASAIGASIEQNMPDIVFIDYLTLLKATGEDWRATASLSADIQGLGSKYQIPIVGLSQINRTGAGKEPPNAEHLSQADAIGHDADLLVTMAQQSTHVMKSKIAKFRHGPTGSIWYSEFDPGKGVYDEVSGDDAAELMETDKDVD